VQRRLPAGANTTAALWAANCRAVARPIAEEAPVITVSR
jgi:hypothetical protein